MSREKQIEEMAKILSENCGCCDNCEYCGILNDGIDCTEYKYAAMLYNAGYRKQEWISVNERLPEESGEYLVCTAWYSHMVLHYSKVHERFNAYDYHEERHVNKYALYPIYWMPLPKPPKGE